MALAIGWDFFELVLPFAFAFESVPNKMGDICINIIGSGPGLYIRSRSKNWIVNNVQILDPSL